MSSLTQKEREVIELLSKGLSNSDIANRLNISINTVKYHLQNIYTKLNVKNRLQATIEYHSQKH